MPEVAGPGWKVKGEPFWNSAHAAWWTRPSPEAITEAYEEAWSQAARGGRRRGSSPCSTTRTGCSRSTGSLRWTRSWNAPIPLPAGSAAPQDAQRDAALARLEAAHAAGVLDAGEFGRRSHRAVKAETGGELAALLADLPAALGGGVRVAVTGAAGYIGGWLCAELDSARPRGPRAGSRDARLRPRRRRTGRRSAPSTCDSQERIGWLRTVEPEAVIHLAALYGRVWGEVDMVKTAGINAGLTAMLARDCASFGARLMFMSSSEVYGETANQRTCYTDARHGLVAPLQPLNMYGMSQEMGRGGRCSGTPRTACRSPG